MIFFKNFKEKPNVQSQPNNNRTKRTYSPSYNTLPSHNFNERDLSSILNLASHESNRIREANKLNTLSNKQKGQSDSINRSASVNYLYNKRQFDMRKYQKDFDQIYHKNHIGFTTEDIDDIYMPNRLNLFESKLKASLDMSDNSEQEEILNRKPHLKSLIQRQSDYQRRFNKNSPNKRYKQDDFFPKFTISLQKTGQTNNPSHYNRHSYMEEAKRKLDANKMSKAYYYNLNNKMKSSVANVMKATQDLGKSNEIRQMKLLNRKCLIFINYYTN